MGRGVGDGNTAACRRTRGIGNLTRPVSAGTVFGNPGASIRYDYVTIFIPVTDGAAKPASEPTAGKSG